jgi:preprotein translocase subunit YajC
MFIPHAYAQAAGAAPAPSGWQAALVNMGPLLLLFVAAWFLLIRPQQQRAKKHAELIGAVKKGDAVVTAGGIVGKVTRVEDRHVEVEIAPNTRIRVVKATLAEVTSGTAKPAND